MNRVNIICKYVKSFLDKTPITINHITRMFMEGLTSDELSMIVDIFYDAYKTADPDDLEEMKAWFFTIFDLCLRNVFPPTTQTHLSKESYAKYDIFSVLFWEDNIEAFNVMYCHADIDLVFSKYSEEVLTNLISRLDLQDVYKLYTRMMPYIVKTPLSVNLYRALVYNILRKEIGYAESNRRDSKNQ